MKSNLSVTPNDEIAAESRRFAPTRKFYSFVSVPLFLVISFYGMRRIEYAVTFHPERYDAQQYAYLPKSGKDVWFVNRDNLRLHGYFIKSTEQPAKTTIIYFHGNGGNLTNVAWLGEKLTQRGFDVLLFDYRGYGRSEGEISSEENLYADADAAYDYAVNELGLSPERIVLYGQSLGTTAVADLAARKPCGAVILESGLSSAKSLASTMLPWLPSWLSWVGKNRFDSAKKLASVHCPIFIAHGDPDNTIPTEHARELFAAANEPKTLKIVAGANHSVSGYSGDKYLDEIAAFVRKAIAENA
jgi:fermentation-respiration switch protein FrsA (DUF1100 family)